MFPNTVNVTQAPGVEGDFASVNPRHSALAPTGDGMTHGFVAGSAGLYIGRFAWADTDGVTLLNTGTTKPLGFVARDMTGLITTFLAESTMMIAPGTIVGSVFDAGDFWVKNAGTASATRGQKAFASTTNGSIAFAAAGATVAGHVETDFYAATGADVGYLVKMTHIAQV